MLRGFFSLLFMVFLLSGSVVMAQRSLPTAEERRVQTGRYNRTVSNPANNPYSRGQEEDDNSTPGKIPNDAVLSVGPPKRAFLDTTVVEIVDGDTIAIKNSKDQRVVIRLMGIDAPELGQEFGKEAKKSLEDKLAGGKVRLAFSPRGVPDEDGRIVAKILVDDVDICEQQVRDGFAWYFEGHETHLGIVEIDELKKMQSEAKKGKIQLWQGKDPQSPWKFRKNAAKETLSSL